MQNIQSAWLSKINWTQAIAFAAMLLTMFGVELPPEVQAQILAGITAISAVVTWAFRTFFTSTVTPAVAAKL
jgi:hypothetical protein